MTVTAEKLKAELAQLAAADRAELAYFLIHSLDEDESVDDEAAWAAELDRRYEEMASNKVAGVPAEVVFRELRVKLS